jgi:hypothetical protein
MGRLRSKVLEGCGKEGRRSGARGGVCFDDGPHAGTAQGEEDGAEGQGEVDVGEPRSSPRQMRASPGFAATTAYAGAHSAGRGVRRVVSAGAAERAAVSVESAGSPERGKVSVAVCCAPSQLL